MSSALTASMTCSSEDAGKAPGCENTSTPSRKAISVGMEVIWAAEAIPRSASVSTLPKTTSGCFSEAASKTGANCRQGPHHSAQKSTSRMSLVVTTCSKSVSVRVVVAMMLLEGRTGLA